MKMTIEQIMTSEQLTKLAESMPAELKQALTTHGFNKIAGVPADVSFDDVAYDIGVKLARSREEWRQVQAGLDALGELVK